MQTASKPPYSDVSLLLAGIEMPFFITKIQSLNHLEGVDLLNVARAFSSINGKNLTFEQLWTGINRICQENWKQLTPDVGNRELFFFAKRRGWISEDRNGLFTVAVRANL
jgi:hypothetical protein